ncbi:MAG TPA: contractile injection system protein, VgrG/Pvc8 family [Streptosporangiaceae bacterium]|nr:contractile injection system protein, VgrG/Pvc8 family [Streptosporangiaceae bacterium]
MPRADLPDLSVRVNGSALPLAAEADLRSVTVQEDLAALSMFTLELHNWDDERLRVSWSDSALFAVGNEVEIWLGYVGDIYKVMLAEITSLEPVFTTGEPPSLLVRGYDHRHRLARGRKTRTFAQMKDSAIAGQIAREAGLRAHVDATEVTLSYVIQSNQSDWDFLRRRASLIGYEMYVRDKVLYFQAPQLSQPPADKLSLGADITEFSPRLSSLTQAAIVTVRGWDVKQKKAIAASARATSGLGGAELGYSVARGAFGTSTMAIFGEPARTTPEADPIARGQFGTGALAYVEGEVVAYGRPQLHAGTVVDIAGAGQKFSGRYYVTTVTHSLTKEQGYQTSFTVQRNATA